MIKDVDIKTKSKLGLENFNLNLPNTFLPSPNSKDYNNGFIYRYVVSKINMSEITEVSSDIYDKIDSNFFKKVKFKWRITGSINNKYEGKMLVEQGVVDFNKKQITDINKTITGIDQVYTNYLQFYKMS